MTTSVLCRGPNDELDALDDALDFHDDLDVFVLPFGCVSAAEVVEVLLLLWCVAAEVTEVRDPPPREVERELPPVRRRAIRRREGTGAGDGAAETEVEGAGAGDGAAEAEREDAEEGDGERLEEERGGGRAYQEVSASSSARIADIVWSS